MTKRKTYMKPSGYLHELMTLAIDTMRGLDRGAYKPEHSEVWQWHNRKWDEPGGPCYFDGLAGAIMTIHYGPHEFVDGGNYNHKMSKHIWSLSLLGKGKVLEAATNVGVGGRVMPRIHQVQIQNWNFCGWEEADAFLLEMEQLRDKLEEEWI